MSLHPGNRFRIRPIRPDGPSRSADAVAPTPRGAAPRVGGTNRTDEERPRRPVPLRTAPIRRVSTAFREDGSGHTPAFAAAPETPAERAVATAYQVFERYQDESQRFAQGQSAWYSDEDNAGNLSRDLARSFADLLGLLGRAATALGRGTPPVFGGPPPAVPPTIARARSAPSASEPLTTAPRGDSPSDDWQWEELNLSPGAVSPDGPHPISAGTVPGSLARGSERGDRSTEERPAEDEPSDAR